MKEALTQLSTKLLSLLLKRKDAPRNEPLPDTFANRRPLVKARPFRLEDAYEPLEDRNLADGFFLRMRRYLYRELDEVNARKPRQLGSVKILRESGRVSDERQYFFLQPLNQNGWLFERSGSGWLISRAQKIVKDNTFLRSYEPWDIVTLFRPKDGNGTPRVSSQRLGADLVSFAVYEQKLNESLELKNA